MCDFSDIRLYLQMVDVDPLYRVTLKEAMTHSFWCDAYVLYLSCLFDRSAHEPSFRNWEAIGKGEVPVPDVGNPPCSIPSADSDVFFGSFSGGGVYLRSDDPLPEFNYVSPFLADDDDDDYEDFNEDSNSDDNYDQSGTADSVTLAPQDSFEDVFLDDPSSDAAVEPAVDSRVLPLPPAAISMSPPPMLFGMVGITTTVTVTVEDDAPSEELAKDELEVEFESFVGIMVAMEVQVSITYRLASSSLLPTALLQRSGFFGRLKSWFNNVASGIVRLCSRVSVC